jgi:hypothetical protein
MTSAQAGSDHAASDAAAAQYLAESRRAYAQYKQMAERAIAQVSDAEFRATLDPEANSIALIVKHLAGNLRSRWTDFLSSDGEKPDRNRDAEFAVEPQDSRESLMRAWEEAWAILSRTLDALSPNDMGRTVLIRGQAHTVLEAINRNLTHVSYHVGQIVFLAKHFRSTDWKTLSIARGQSSTFVPPPRTTA